MFNSRCFFSPLASNLTAFHLGRDHDLVLTHVTLDPDSVSATPGLGHDHGGLDYIPNSKKA